jgi:prephenate dehydratase
LPHRTFAALFASLDEDVADYALAPIQNSLAGIVPGILELMSERALSICGEVSINVSQNLIGCPGASLEQITAVQSHPMALAQCRRFFADHPAIEAIAADDTAGSVAQIINHADKTRAAIASRRAAEIYGGVILREHLEDESENVTAFVLLARRNG